MIPIDKYPTDGATNENVLFSSLGAFWTQVFADQAALRGLTLAKAEEIFQSYYELIEAIDSFSAEQISVFKKVKWLPLLIKRSELNSNVLKFGEDVLFDAEDYKFGAARPTGENIFVVPLPNDLRELSIITNRVISPDFVLVNNIDVQVKDGYLYFYGNPFELPNKNSFNLLDSDGDQVFYAHPLTGQPIPDEVLVLWVYHGKISSEALNYNIAYLFGVNLPDTQQSKEILEATVKLFSSGPTVHQLKAVCGAFLGAKPICEANETITDIIETSTHSVIVTDQHVYRYDKYYMIDPSLKVGSVLSAGDVPVDAVEFYDNVIFRDWWLTKMTPKITANIAAINSEVVPASPAVTLPPYMFVGSYKFGLTFKNELELATRAADGSIYFPVYGDATDVKNFQTQVNKNQSLFAKALTSDPAHPLQNGSAILVNPLDFLFRTLFRHNTALIKLNFKNEAQMQFFTKYFSVIKNCLPKHVYIIFLCDLTVSSDLYTTSSIIDTDEPTHTSQEVDANSGNYNVDPAELPVTIHYPLQGSETVVSMNSIASQGATQNALCKELVIVRTIPNGVSTRDYSFLDITKLPS